MTTAMLSVEKKTVCNYIGLADIVNKASKQWQRQYWQWPKAMGYDKGFVDCVNKAVGNHNSLDDCVKKTMCNDNGLTDSF